MIETVIAILGGGFVLLILGVAGLNSMFARNQAKVANAEVVLRDRFGEGDYYSVLPGPRCIGIAWGQGSLILGDSVEAATAVPLADIRSSDIELDGVNVTSTRTVTTSNRGSQLTGGLVGGVLLGPAGLVVGGVSGGSISKGKSVETRKIKSVKLVIRVADRTQPLRTFVFFDIGFGDGYDADSAIVAPEIEKANHFHALLTQVIEDRSAVPTAIEVA
jgi:hypothetical protein